MYDFKINVDTDIFLKDADKLLVEHWEELALNKNKIKLKPDVKKYKLLQELDILHNIVVYKDGVVVGYSVLIVQPHLHYYEHIFAMVDVVYVGQEYRSSSVGARLLVATEKLAKDLGASVITHHAKPYVPMIIKPLEKLGYNLYEHIYGKYIGE
jgi:GNAT superfamily N-acetyltransferase